MSSIEKKVAVAITAAICNVREEISNIQLNLIETIDSRVNGLSVPILEKIVQRLNDLEIDKDRLTSLIESKSIQIIEEHIHNNTIQNIDVDIPNDVIRQHNIDALTTKLDESFQSILTEMIQIKDVALPSLSNIYHNHDGIYATFDHSHDDIWSEVRTLERLQTDDRQKTLEFNSNLLNRVDKSDASVKAELLNLISHIEESKEAIWKDFNKHSDETEKKLSDLISDLSKSLNVFERDVGLRLKSLDKEYQLIGEELQNALKRVSAKLNDGLESKANIQHYHPEFKTFSQKDHTHKEFDKFSKLLDKIDTNTLKKSDINSLIDGVLKKIPEPIPGKDGIGWEFKFDKSDEGILLYRKEGDSKWNKQDLRGPRGLPGKNSDGGGFGGGGGGSILDIKKNGTLVGRGITALDFAGPVNVTNPTSGIARIEIVGSSGGGSSVRQYFTSVSLTANIPLAIVHGLNLTDRDAFQINVMKNHGQISVSVESIDVNGLIITSNVTLSDVKVTVTGASST